MNPHTWIILTLLAVGSLFLAIGNFIQTQNIKELTRRVDQLEARQ